MKSNKGITLTSLLVYIIGLMIVLTMVATFTGYFTKNINETTIKDVINEQHTKFVSYITKDINSEEITYIKTASSSRNYFIIYLKDGIEHQYVYSDGNIYFINIENDTITKKITLCSNVSSNTENIFTYENNILSYNFKIYSDDFSGSFNVKFD